MPVWAFSKVFLVSIGISDYPGTDIDLRLPANDAKTMAGVYKNAADVEYHVILDSLAKRFIVTTAMDNIFSRANEDDMVVLFYSGHGCKGGLYLYDGVLDYSAIRHAMSKSKSKHKMIFVDACFSGKIRNENKHSAEGDRRAKHANVMLFLSSGSEETSLESSDMDHSIFTHFLAKGLFGSADGNHDCVITAKELFRYVHANVVKKSGGQQHPAMWGRFSDDMPVLYRLIDR